MGMPSKLAGATAVFAIGFVFVRKFLYLSLNI